MHVSDIQISMHRNVTGLLFSFSVYMKQYFLHANTDVNISNIPSPQGEKKQNKKTNLTKMSYIVVCLDVNECCFGSLLQNQRFHNKRAVGLKMSLLMSDYKNIFRLPVD